jgi:lysozyme
MLKLLNKGDFAGAAAEFPKWNKDNGKVVKGLTNRRLREQALFLTLAVQIPLKMD